MVGSGCEALGVAFLGPPKGFPSVVVERHPEAAASGRFVEDVIEPVALKIRGVRQLAAEVVEGRRRGEGKIQLGLLSR